MLLALLCTLLSMADHAGAKPASSNGVSPPPVAGFNPAVRANGLSFRLPPTWKQAKPSSAMRMAQATIPGAGGPAEFVAYFFGAGSGGDAESNIARWIAQVESAPDTSPTRDRFETHGLAVTWVDVTGTLKPGQMGMGPGDPQPGSRLFGAVIEGPGGPWFFKATGPAATLAGERDAFLEVLESVQPE